MSVSICQNVCYPHKFRHHYSLGYYVFDLGSSSVCIVCAVFGVVFMMMLNVADGFMVKLVERIPRRC